MQSDRFKLPKLCRHKTSNLAYVKWKGKRYYLGKWDTTESREAYQAFTENLRRLHDDTGVWTTSIARVAVEFLKHAEIHYRRPDGELSSEHNCHLQALRVLVDLFGDEVAADFGPKKLKKVQEVLASRYSRSTANRHLSRLKHVFSWAVSCELVPVTTADALTHVRGLQRGRTKAKEPEPVRPVSTEHINATLPKLSRQVRDMVRLQLLCGCRPAEITILRPCDIDKTGDVWEYTPASHKTEHHGKERRIYFGPRAQAVLEEWIENRQADAYCFSPIEAEAERRERQREERQTPVQPSQQKRAEEAANRKDKRNRKPHEHYNTASYRRAIARACEEAEVPNWTPNQLRHSRATDLRKMFGIEAAQTVCGHASMNTTQIYAEANFDKARAVMGEVG